NLLPRLDHESTHGRYRALVIGTVWRERTCVVVVAILLNLLLASAQGHENPVIREREDIRQRNTGRFDAIRRLRFEEHPPNEEVRIRRRRRNGIVETAGEAREETRERVGILRVELEYRA